MTKITIGARRSPLAQAQVQEVLNEILVYFPKISFDCLLVDTQGDKDKQTSLRTLGKTDFFTKEIDDLLLSKACRIAIHSAKDLPEPLPKGIKIAALTKGVDPADVIVFREKDSLFSLPSGAVIATSSQRREETVKKLRNDLKFIDLRGTINERLAKLDEGIADAVVLAEAALIRLGLTHLNRMFLPGETTPRQGQLAIVAREDDNDMFSLFTCIDARHKSL